MIGRPTPQRPGSELVTRRRILLGAGALGVGLLPGCRGDKPSQPASAGVPNVTVARHAYGADASQYAELYLPHRRTQTGVVVIVHGGFWLAEYGLGYGAPLAKDLARRGYAALNLEYRRVGNGGGWPTTFDDVAAGIDLVATLPVGAAPVVVVGHSAGGQLAAWAAARPTLPGGAPGSRPRVRVHAVVSQAGVLDLRTAVAQQVGGTAVPDLLGGTPAQLPDRYRLADPIEQVPATVPVVCVHSKADQLVPYSQSEHYVGAARAAGGRAELVTVTGDHFALIDPASSAWRAVLQRLPALFASR